MITANAMSFGAFRQSWRQVYTYIQNGFFLKVDRSIHICSLCCCIELSLFFYFFLLYAIIRKIAFQIL